MNAVSTAAIAAPEPAQPRLDQQHPYPGLSPFAEGDSGYFHGREEETDELYRLVRRGVLTVLFGRSGLGKTSLLHAGLFPRLRDAQYFPVSLRICYGEAAPDPLAQVLQTLLGEVARHEAVAPEPNAAETLWEYFHRAKFRTTAGRPLVPLLVFDQFEEIFTLGARDPRREALLTGLSELAENRVPEAVRARLEAGDEAEFDFDAQDYRLLVSLREDYLPDLEDLQKRIPSLTRNRFRLTPLSGAQSLRAVLEPGGNLVDETVARSIVEMVAKAGAEERPVIGDADFERLEVEPSLLNLVCRQLNEQRIRDGQPAITAVQAAGSRERLLGGFYLETTADVPALRVFIEDRLLTPSGRNRRAEAVEEACMLPGVDEPSLNRLVDRRLLRREERLGIPHVELIHDVLAPIAATSRDRRRADDKTRRERRKAMAWVAALGVLFVILATLGAVFFGLFRDAETQRVLAEATRKEAEGLVDFMLFDLREILEPVGRLDALEKVAEKALEYYARLPPENADEEALRNRGVALNNIGDVFLAKGDLERALSAYRERYAIAGRLAAKEPENTHWQRDLSVGRNRIGDVLAAQGHWEQALAEYRAGLASRQGLAARDPANAEWQRDLSVSHNKVGDALKVAGQLDTALAEYSKGLEIRQRLATQDGTNAEAQRELSVSQNKVGDVLAAQGQLDAALAEYRKGLETTQRLAATDGTNPEWQRGLSASHDKVGDVLAARGHLDAALDEYRASLASRRRLAAQDETNAKSQLELSRVNNRIGYLLLRKREFAQAAETIERARAILDTLARQSPDWKDPQTDLVWTRTRLAEANGALAYALLLDRKFPEAIAASRKAIELAPDKPWLKTNLAHGLLFTGRSEEAGAIYLENRKLPANNGSDKTFAQVVLEDFREFRSKGLAHPELGKIEKLMRSR